jgi:hypothetical protein
MIKREKSIISNRLNRSMSANRSLDSSYISKLSAIKSKIERKDEVYIYLFSIIGC